MFVKSPATFMLLELPVSVPETTTLLKEVVEEPPTVEVPLKTTVPLPRVNVPLFSHWPPKLKVPVVKERVPEVVKSPETFNV